MLLGEPHGLLEIPCADFSQDPKIFAFDGQLFFQLAEAKKPNELSDEKNENDHN